MTEVTPIKFHMFYTNSLPSRPSTAQVKFPAILDSNYSVLSVSDKISTWVGGGRQDGGF